MDTRGTAADGRLRPGAARKADAEVARRGSSTDRGDGMVVSVVDKVGR